MIYSVKEIYLTVQGEGAQAGIVAVFLRFAGCNLWSGLERDREKAQCKFCDTDFIGTDGLNGGKFKTAKELASFVNYIWPKNEPKLPKNTAKKVQKWVICTGGEPLLQLDPALIDAFHAEDFKVAVETNGTILAPSSLDWVCVSPKADVPLIQVKGDELKLVYPQAENIPNDFADLDFTHFCLQPRDPSAEFPRGAATKKAAHEKAAFDYCLANPQWRLSVQTHKMIGVP